MAQRSLSFRTPSATVAAAVAVAAVLALACGPSLTVRPAVAVRAVPSDPIRGRLLYSGDPDLVPRMLEADERSPAIFVYSLSTQTQRSPLPLLSSLGPLSLLGIPTDQSVATVSARLEIRLGNRRVAEYSATARATQLRGAYSPDRMALLQRRAEGGIRNNLDAQLINDLANLRRSLPQ